MAVMEVMLQQTYLGQVCINRWNYISSGTPAGSTLSLLLAGAIGAIYDNSAVPPAYPASGLMKAIAAIQSTSCQFDLVSVRDVYSVTDFYETPFVQPLAGTSAGETMSPAIAIGFRTTRVRTDVRRATKRFTGVTESLTQAGGEITAALKTGAALTVATKMTDVLTVNDDGNTVTFAPAVCGKEGYWPSGTEGVGKKAYKYYETEAEQMLHTAQGIAWDFYNFVRTQTSRQYGRGR